MPDFERWVAFEKSVKELEQETSGRVRLTGTVITLFNDSFILDDQTGTVQIFLNPEISFNVKENDIVQVVGRLIPTESGVGINAEIIRVTNNLNLSLYNKVKDLWRKVI